MSSEELKQMVQDDSDAFKAKITELCRKKGWSVRDWEARYGSLDQKEGSLFISGKSALQLFERRENLLQYALGYRTKREMCNDSEVFVESAQKLECLLDDLDHIMAMPQLPSFSVLVSQELELIKQGALPFEISRKDYFMANEAEKIASETKRITDELIKAMQEKAEKFIEFTAGKDVADVTLGINVYDSAVHLCYRPESLMTAGEKIRTITEMYVRQLITLYSYSWSNLMNMEMMANGVRIAELYDWGLLNAASLKNAAFKFLRKFSRADLAEADIPISLIEDLGLTGKLSD